MKKIVTWILICYAIIASILFIPKAYAKYRGTGSSTPTTVSAARWIVSINGATTNSTINLNNTISQNNYSNTLAPGTYGVAPLVLDFTNLDVVTDYTITFVRTNLPTNLHFYSDSNHTTEIQNISGTYTPGTSPLTLTTNLYWQWIYSETDANNTNDSQFMNTSVTLTVQVSASQRTGGGS